MLVNYKPHNLKSLQNSKALLTQYKNKGIDSIEEALADLEKEIDVRVLTTDFNNIPERERAQAWQRKQTRILQKSPELRCPECGMGVLKSLPIEGIYVQTCRWGGDTGCGFSRMIGEMR